jgi:hypothetical protein
MDGRREAGQIPGMTDDDEPGRVYPRLTAAQMDAVLGELRRGMLEGVVEQVSMALPDRTPESTREQYPDPLVNLREPRPSDDREIRDLLVQIGPGRVRRALVALDARIPHADWSQNVLALCYGGPGRLRHAVLKADQRVYLKGFPPWDEDLLRLVERLLDAPWADRLHYHQRGPAGAAGRAVPRGHRGRCLVGDPARGRETAPAAVVAAEAGRLVRWAGAADVPTGRLATACGNASHSRWVRPTGRCRRW